MFMCIRLWTRGRSRGSGRDGRRGRGIGKIRGGSRGRCRVRGWSSIIIRSRTRGRGRCGVGVKRSVLLCYL